MTLKMILDNSSKKEKSPFELYQEKNKPESSTEPKKDDQKRIRSYREIVDKAYEYFAKYGEEDNRSIWKIWYDGYYKALEWVLIDDRWVMEENERLGKKFRETEQKD